MLAAHISAAFCQRRYDHLIYSQIIYTDSRTYNIDNGINRSYLMKMHLLNRKPVGLRLCLRNNQKHFSGQLLYMLIGIQPINNCINIMQVPMLMRMCMLVVMLVLMAVLMLVAVLVAVTVLMAVLVLVAVAVTVLMLVAVLMLMAVLMLQMHIKVKGIQPAGHLPSKMKMISVHLHTVKHPLQLCPIRSQIKQSSYRHISADS